MKKKSCKLLISLFFLTLLLVGVCLKSEKVYAATPTNITSAEILGSGFKKPKSGENVFIPDVSIKSITPSEAISNVKVETWWIHDGEYIYKSDVEEKNPKFEQGEYELYVYIMVDDSEKNIFDYKKFPDRIKIDGYELQLEADCDYYVGYGILFEIDAKSETKPTIKTEEIINAKKGLEYNIQLKALGSETITWSVDKGSTLPKGLKISKDGILSGTPEEAGTFDFNIVASNKYGSCSKKYTLKISDVNRITTAKLLNAEIKKPTLGQKMYIPVVSIDSISPAKASSNVYVDVWWQYNNGNYIYKEDIKKDNLKFKIGDYSLMIYFFVKDSEKSIFDYNKFNQSLKINGLNFKKCAECNDYVGYMYSFKVVPTKVKNVKVKSQKENKITLNWSKNSEKVTGYKVYQYNSKTKKYDYVGKTKQTNYTIKKLKSGTNYKFKVRAYKTVDDTQYFGSYSSVIKTATKPSTTKIKTLTTKNKKVTVNWNKVAGATGYEVYMSTNKNKGYSRIKTITKKGTVSYTKGSLKKNKTYYFKIRTYKIVNEKKIYSSYSNIKQIKVK